MRALGQLLLVTLELLRRAAQECSLRFAAQLRVAGEGVMCELDGGFDLRRRCRVIRRSECTAGLRIRCLKSCAVAGAAPVAEEGEAGKFHESIHDEFSIFSFQSISSVPPPRDWSAI